MNYNLLHAKFSSVEKHFFDQQSIKDQTSQIPYIVLDNSSSLD